MNARVKSLLGSVAVLAAGLVVASVVITHFGELTTPAPKAIPGNPTEDRARVEIEHMIEITPVDVAGSDDDQRRRDERYTSLADAIAGMTTEELIFYKQHVRSGGRESLLRWLDNRRADHAERTGTDTANIRTDARDQGTIRLATPGRTTH